MHTGFHKLHNEDIEFRNNSLIFGSEKLKTYKKSGHINDLIQIDFKGKSRYISESELNQLEDPFKNAILTTLTGNLSNDEMEKIIEIFNNNLSFEKYKAKSAETQFKKFENHMKISFSDKAKMSIIKPQDEESYQRPSEDSVKINELVSIFRKLVENDSVNKSIKDMDVKNEFTIDEILKIKKIIAIDKISNIATQIALSLSKI